MIMMINSQRCNLLNFPLQILVNQSAREISNDRYEIATRWIRTFNNFLSRWIEAVLDLIFVRHDDMRCRCPCRDLIWFVYIKVNLKNSERLFIILTTSGVTDLVDYIRAVNFLCKRSDEQKHIAFPVHNYVKAKNQWPMIRQLR